MLREVALVGGGHAHIEVIRRFGEKPPPDARLSVFDPNPRPVYSGMVPGFVAGQYDAAELEIDLEALCSQAGATFVHGAVTAIDADRRTLSLERGEFPYDIASLDIGSTVAGTHLPGVREYTLPSRPIAGLMANVWKLVDGQSDDTSSAPECLHVVGGGAGGVELAFCLDAHVRAQLGAPLDVAIITREESVLDGAAPRLRARVERALARRKIQVLPNASVSAVREGAIELANGERLRSSGAVWVTGPAPHALAADSDLPVDEFGFIRIAPSFLVEGQASLFAVGDCASLPGMRKAGVYAVRAGPLLDGNLRALLKGKGLREYVPQDDFLSLLNLGNGSAIGSKWGLAFEGRAAMWLKDRIDRSFMEKYQ